MILVTGGAGYIGSHTVIALAQTGYKTLTLNNLPDSHSAVLDTPEGISGARPNFIEGDIRDGDLLDSIFKQNPTHSVMHFADLKSLSASEAASTRPIECEIVSRRSGDIAECWAAPSHAESALDWKTNHGLEQMCADSWRWQQRNPEGYQ